MNILLAAMALDIGGAETHVVELAKELKRIGHRPIVVSAGGVYIKELEENNIYHYEAPLNRKNIMSLVKSIEALLKIIKEEKVDLLHAHGRIPALNCKIVSMLKGIPFMTTAHAKLKASLIYKYTSFWGKETISVSEDIKEHLINIFNVRPEKITIITNGIDTAKFSPRAETTEVKSEFKISNNTMKVVYISRISGPLTKVVKLFIEAAREIYKELDNIEFIIAGDGEDFEEIRDGAEEVNSQANKRLIHILGKRTDIPQILSLSNLVVCVSRTALEAMSCEKPVILAGGEGYMGLLTEENMDAAILDNFTCRTSKNKIDTAILKNEILKAIAPSNEEKRRDLGELGRKVVEDQFSIETMTKMTVDIYTKLLKGV